MIVAAMAAAVASATPTPQFSSDGAGTSPAEICAFEEVESHLRGASQWHDLSPVARGNPALAAQFSSMMPGYELAFVHEGSMGILLVGGANLPALSQSGAAASVFWADAAEAARRSCSVEGVDCEIRTFEEAPFGLAATTRIDAEGDIFRRESLSFIDGRSCSYSIQFTGQEAALGEDGWHGIRESLHHLRSWITERHRAGL